MPETIEPIGYESSKRIGKLKIHNKSILVTLHDEEINLHLTFRNQKEYYYLDFIENTVNSFNFVCHIVKADGIETDVIATFFLRYEKDLELLRGLLDQLNKDNKVIRKNQPNNQIKRTLEVNTGNGWLSRRKE
jgi:hypothetical protein